MNNNNYITVELFTVPQAACDSSKANWTQVGEMIKNQLRVRFKNTISFNHIEFMTEKWFANPRASEILENGNINFPFVLVDGEIASAGKKINISQVIRTIQQKIDITK